MIPEIEAEANEVMFKAGKVCRSCTTQGQLRVSNRYMKLATRRAKLLGLMRPDLSIAYVHGQGGWPLRLPTIYHRQPCEYPGCSHTAQWSMVGYNLKVCGACFALDPLLLRGAVLLRAKARRDARWGKG